METTLPEWPHVLIREDQMERLKAALEFSDSLPKDAPGTLRERLNYLESYGASPDGSVRRYRVSLGFDWAAHSFSVLWEKQSDGSWVPAFNGGLICHCSGEEPFCVSLVPQAWGIHT